MHEAFYGNTGPIVHKWRHYLSIYDRHLSRYRSTPVRLLEIGMFKGGSLQMWRRYFGIDARIYGIDIDPSCATYNGGGGHVRDWAAGGSCLPPPAREFRDPVSSAGRQRRLYLRGYSHRLLAGPLRRRLSEEVEFHRTPSFRDSRPVYSRSSRSPFVCGADITRKRTGLWLELWAR